MLEDELGKDDGWPVRMPSIADVDIYGVVRYAREGDFDLSTYPNVKAWMARIEASWLSSAGKFLPQKSAQDV